jgi:hypothetical protein
MPAALEPMMGPSLLKFRQAAMVAHEHEHVLGV